MAVLFISRGTVSGVQILINRLCELTGFKCLSREDLVKEVSRYGDWATEAVNQLSKATSAYEHFSRIRRPYIVLMRQALLEKIREDNIVYYGFSGHMLVPRLKHFVRVRINAPLSLRVPMTMERLKCDEESAREYIRNSDDYQVKWARFVYGRDVRDPALYDLNINLGHLTIEVVCGILKHVLLEKDLQASSELKAEVERLFLAASVEAALIIDPRTRELEIDANVENGSIHLNGPYLEDSNLEVVMGIARSVDGIAKVEYSPGYASQYRLEEHEEKYRSQLPV
jgi:cytidylate kinase